MFLQRVNCGIPTSPALSRRSGTSVWRSPRERVEHDAVVASLRTSMGDEALTGSWADGEAMTLEEAVAYALEEGPDA